MGVLQAWLGQRSLLQPRPLPSPDRHLWGCAGSCAQWEMYDEYVRDLERQKAEEAAKQKGPKKLAPAATSGSGTAGAPAAPPPPGGRGRGDGDGERTSRVVERMVNQNMFEEIAADFKYWEDASDMYRQVRARTAGF